MRKAGFFFILILVFFVITGCGISIPDNKNSENVLMSPENFTGKKIGSEAVFFTWDSVQGAEQYNLYYSYKQNDDERVKEIKADIAKNYYYLNKLPGNGETIVVEPVSEGKKGYISTIKKDSITKYFGELNYYPNEQRLVWTKWPVENAQYCLVVKQSDNYSKEYTANSISQISDSFFTKNYYECEEINSNSYYAVYVLVDSQYRLMTGWYSGTQLSLYAKEESSGILPPESLNPVTDLEMTKFTIGSEPVFDLSWTAVENAASYKVYAVLGSQTMSESALANSWYPLSDVSDNKYSVKLKDYSLLSYWNSNKSNNSNSVIYFKVESENKKYNLNGGASNIINLEIPKETYNYKCTYTYHDYKQNGPKLTVWRTGSHDYILSWDNPTEDYYIIAYKDGTAGYVYWKSAISSGNTLQNSSHQASKSYDFILCTSQNSSETRVSNYVLCEFE